MFAMSIFYRWGKNKRSLLWPNYPTPVVSNYSLVNLSARLVHRHTDPRAHFSANNSSFMGLFSLGLSLLLAKAMTLR